MMHNFSMSMILVSIFTISCKSNRSNVTQEELPKAIIANVSNHQDSKSCDSLLALIPSNEKEYLEFYDLTNNKKTNDIFLNRYDKIKKAANRDSCGSLKKFLFMSQFVDGEFAESYYDDVTFIIDNNPKMFCELFKLYGSKELKHFKEDFEDNCK